MFELTQTRDNITPTLMRWGLAMRKDMGKVVTEGGKRITRQVVAITPPSHAGGGSLTGSADAFRTGKLRIARQMSSILAPKRLKGRRLITHVFGRPMKRPVYAKTRELWPDVAGVYRANTRYNSEGRVRVKQGAKFYVSSTKYKRLQSQKYGKVGMLASGWNSGAHKLGVATPAFIKRHGLGRGSSTVSLAGMDVSVRVENFGISSNGRSYSGRTRMDTARRVTWAVNSVARGMRDNIDHAARRSAIQSGVPMRGGKVVPFPVAE